MATKIKVLAIDDSALIRQLLTKIVNSDPALEMVGTAAQLATSIMASNDETDDDTKRKVVPAWEFDRRTQEIMKKRRKRQAALRRYFA